MNRSPYTLTKFLLIVLASILVLTSILVTPSDNVPEHTFSSYEPPVSMDYTSHSRIVATSDAQLLNLVSSEGWPGNGSKDNHFIIAGYSIKGSDYCIRIESVSYYVTIRDCLLYNSSSIIRFANVKGALIENNTIMNADYNGFDSWSAKDSILIRNNTFKNISAFKNISGFEGYGGIRLSSSHNCTIVNNSFIDTKQGVYLSSSHNTRVLNNIFKDPYKGTDGSSLRVLNCVNTAISGNTITSNSTVSRLRIEKSWNTTMKNNTMNGTGLWLSINSAGQLGTSSIDETNTINGTAVLFLNGKENLTVTKKHSQLIAVNCSNVTVKDFHNPSQFFGVFIYKCNEFNLTNCTYTNPAIGKVNFISTIGGLYNSTIRYNQIRILRGRTTIEGNSINHVDIAITIMGDRANISRNTIGPNVTTGMMLGHAEATVDHTQTRWTQIHNNNINTTKQAILIGYRTHNITMRGNTLLRSCIRFNGMLHGRSFSAMYGSHDIDITNTIDGKPILYVSYKEGITISGAYGMVLLAYSTNVTIQDLYISGGTIGLIVGKCTWTELSNVTVKNTKDCGIEILESSGCTLDSNTVEGCPTGIFAFDCQNTMIINNKVHKAGSWAMYIERCWYTTVRCNNVTNSSDYGIFLLSGRYNSVVYNNIEGCIRFGLRPSYETGTTIHHNNFIENKKDPVTGESLGPQATNSGYPCSWDNGAEGNYWSNYRYRYPNSSHNGTVWNISYGVGGGLLDNYPLVSPVDTSSPNIIGLGKDMTVDQGTTLWRDVSNSTDNVGIIRYLWSILYNGTWYNSTTPKINFTFDLVGVFHISLRIEDSSGNWDTGSITVTVLDITAPVADAGPNIEIDQGENVIFNATASTDNVGIVNYTWSFSYNGTDYNLSGVITNHTFDIPGEYIITLIVQDERRNSGRTNVTITVLDTEQPVIIISGGNTEVDQGTQVELNASASHDNVGIVNYTWQFTYNGTLLSFHNAILNFLFDIPRNYTIKFTVFDLAGNSLSKEIWILVHDIEVPMAVAGPDMMVDQGTNVHLDATRSTDNVGIVSYRWYFSYNNSNTTLYGSTPTFDFDVPGIYNITLLVRDGEDNSARDWIVVTVNDIESPIARAGNDITVDQGTIVFLNASGSTDNIDIVSFTWKFIYGGGNVTLYGRIASFQFDMVGEYAVTLEVIDGADNSANDSLVVNVLDTEPPLPMTDPLLTLLTGTYHEFDGSDSTDNVDVVTYVWTVIFDDEEEILYGPNPSFLFRLSGEYLVTLNVSDAAGNSATSLIHVSVLDKVPPVIKSVGGMSTDNMITITLAESTEVWLPTVVEDLDSSVFSYSLQTDLDDAEVLSNGTLRLRAAHGVLGEFWAKLVVDDLDGGTDEVDITVIVVNVNDPPAVPIITSPLNGSEVDEGENVTFGVTFDDPDLTWGQVLDITWSSNLSGHLAMFTSEDAVDFTVDTLANGTHLVTVTVSDGEYERSSTVWFSCIPVNGSPSI